MPFYHPFYHPKPASSPKSPIPFQFQSLLITGRIIPLTTGISSCHPGLLGPDWRHCSVSSRSLPWRSGYGVGLLQKERYHFFNLSSLKIRNHSHVYRLMSISWCSICCPLKISIDKHKDPPYSIGRESHKKVPPPQWNCGLMFNNATVDKSTMSPIFTRQLHLNVLIQKLQRCPGAHKS